jgi:hypothetical protein
MTVVGTSRQFAATEHIGRYRSEADMNPQVKPAGSSKMTRLRHRQVSYVAVAMQQVFVSFPPLRALRPSMNMALQILK